MKANRVIKLPVFRVMFFPVAQKAWRCDICHKPVEMGRRYIHYIDRRPHEIINYRFHKECFQIVELYCTINKKTTFTPRSVLYWAKRAYCNACPNDCRIHPCATVMHDVNKKLKKKKRQSNKSDIQY